MQGNDSGTGVLLGMTSNHTGRLLGEAIRVVSSSEPALVNPAQVGASAAICCHTGVSGTYSLSSSLDSPTGISNVSTPTVAGEEYSMTLGNLALTPTLARMLGIEWVAEQVGTAADPTEGERLATPRFNLADLSRYIAGYDSPSETAATEASNPGAISIGSQSTVESEAIVHSGSAGGLTYASGELSTHAASRPATPIFRLLANAGIEEILPSAAPSCS